jgi:hypothetical protein
MIAETGWKRNNSPKDRENRLKLTLMIESLKAQVAACPTAVVSQLG